MISHQSASFSRGLALAFLLVLTGSSCLNTQGSGSHTPAVRDGSDYTPAESRSFEPEYFQGQAAPEIPAALPEERPSAPSPSHVWIAGYHTRRNGEWAWVSGQYAVPPSTDVVWVPGHWVAHLDGYAWIAGAWR